MKTGLAALPPGYVARCYAEVGSTNEVAMELLRGGAPSGTVVQAAAQSGGRGRDGRRWQSPSGNLYASLALRPPGRPGEVAQLSFASAVAVARTAEMFLGAAAPVSLKWPNDVLLAGHKLAGILLESDGVRPDGVDGLVIGIGINVAVSPALTADGGLSSTCLVERMPAGVEPPSVGAVLGALVGCFDGLYRSWCDGGFAPIRSAWMARAHGLGRQITARLPRESLRGRFVDLDPGGALILETPAGRHVVHAGDVFFDPEAC
jgi:BirA family biotin operon repressor/biotin-[acetyl-CoA-carboxylase] ligase